MRFGVALLSGLVGIALTLYVGMIAWWSLSSGGSKIGITNATGALNVGIYCVVLVFNAVLAFTVCFRSIRR